MLREMLVIHKFAHKLFIVCHVLKLLKKIILFFKNNFIIWHAINNVCKFVLSFLSLNQFG